MARPSNYLGANLTLQDTFSSLVERSNEVAYDLGTVIVTTAPVSQANTTNGALTAGNAHVQGFFSANTLIASDQLRGGSIDASALLTVTSNTSFTGARIYTSDTTISDFGANVTLSAASADNLTKHSIVDFGNTHFTQGELRVSGNTIFDNTDAIVEVFTNTVDITANVEIRAKRRFTQLQKKEQNINYQIILDKLKQRDYNDINRSQSPLKIATDAIIIDNSHLDIDQTFAKIIKYISCN